MSATLITVPALVLIATDWLFRMRSKGSRHYASRVPVRGKTSATAKALLVVCALTCTGCATVINETTHPMKIETKTESGDLVTGAECKMTNDYGSTVVKSGETAQVRRSGKDLNIHCVHPDNPDASARAISRANGGMWGNIILGGGIGAIVDHNRGTAYTYPTWVQLVFGKNLVFDRSAEKKGEPTLGTEPALSTASATDANSNTR